MTAELLWLLVAADPTVGNPTEMPMFRKASKLSVSKSRNQPRGEGQVTHNWLLKQYHRKLLENGMDPAKAKLFKLHSPRIIGATTLFASGKSDMHLKSKVGGLVISPSSTLGSAQRWTVKLRGRWARLMRHPSWNALTLTGHLFLDGPKTQQTWATTRSLTMVTKPYQTTKATGATGSVTRGPGWFLRLRFGRHVLRRRHADDVARDAASRHTTTNYQLASLSYVLNKNQPHSREGHIKD